MSTPIKSIRKYCLYCQNNSHEEISNCTSKDECALYLYRFGKRPKTKIRLTPVKSIRKKCIDCIESLADIKNCKFSDCSLYNFRMGKRPKQSR